MIYFTRTGHTKQAVEDISKGLEKKGVEFDILNVKDLKINDIPFSEYDILVIGSPTHAAGPARKITKFVKKLSAQHIENKRIGLVTCHAFFGGNQTLKRLENLLKNLNPDTKTENIIVTAGVPASLWKGPNASEKDVEKCIELGEKLGNI